MKRALLSPSGCGSLRKLNGRKSTFRLAPSRGRVCAGAPLRRSAPKARRLRCGARVSVAPQYSLHSLRSLRSNSCGESDHEARGYARRPKPSAPRRRTGAPAHTRPRLGAGAMVLCWRRARAGHRARPSPRGAPAARGKPRARCPWLAKHSPPRTIASRKAWGRPVPGCVGDGEERSPGVGARTRALRKLTRRKCLNATSAASEVSFAARSQGEYRSAPCKAGRRLRSPAPAGSMPCIRTTPKQAHLQTAANSHRRQQAEPHLMQRISRTAPRSH
jgi:hypothetical protein